MYVVRSAQRRLRVLLDTEEDAGYGNVLVDGFGRAHFFRNASAAAEHQDTNPGGDLEMSAQYVPHAATCRARADERERPRLFRELQGSLL